MQPEQHFIERLKEKRLDALRELYDHYGDALYGVIFRIVAHPEAAEEIQQNVFLKVWQRIDDFDPSRGRLFTWLLNIARNASIDHLRSRQHKQLQSIQPYDHLVDLPEAGTTTPGFDHIGLRELVGQLDQRQQEVIELIYFGGFTQAETAQKLNLPLGTVKSRVRSALKVLRNYFN